MAKKRRLQPRSKINPIRKLTFQDWLVLPVFFLVLFLIKIGEATKSIVRFVYHILIYDVRKRVSRIEVKPPKWRLPKLPNLKLPTLPKAKIALPKISRPLTTYKVKWFLIGVFFTLFFFFLPFQIWSFLTSLPHPQLLSLREIPVTTKIFDRKGFLLYEIYIEQNRTPVKLNEIPPSLKEATLAIEDRDFYRHPGFSPRGILRAAKEIILTGHLQGGSTITQQLVRSALLNPEVSLTRKVKEILLSFWAERLYSKEQILEMYFNQVPYGGMAWGVEAAAQTYFGKGVKDLKIHEAAFLAGLPSAPSVYSPFGIHPELGLARQKEVLKRMSDNGYLSENERKRAEDEKLIFLPPKIKIAAPHFVMYIKELLEKKYGPRLVYQGGLRVTTTLDLPSQEMVQEVVTNEVEKLAGLKVGNGAALLTKPSTGEILAMAGSKDYFNLQEEGNVNVALSLQQPGSAIKVVNYALALENGFTAATILDDSPVTFQIAGQPPYTPVNYDGKFHGKITLREALGNSFNVPAVKVLSQLGVKKMIEQGRRMGIASWQDESRYGLSLTLGGGEVSMLEMAKVYGVLANQGQRQELSALLKITDYKGQILEEFQPKPGPPVVSRAVAFLLSDILADNRARSLAFGPNSLLHLLGKTVAVKTGTSNDLRDNWAIGYTPSYLVVTWVGNNDNSPMSYVASGVTGATPIWHQIMKNLLKDQKDEPFLPPAEVVKVEVCGHSEYFIRGTEKNIVCPPPPSPSPSPTPMP